MNHFHLTQFLEYNMRKQKQAGTKRIAERQNLKAEDKKATEQREKLVEAGKIER